MTGVWVTLLAMVVSESGRMSAVWVNMLYLHCSICLLILTDFVDMMMTCCEYLSCMVYGKAILQ